MNIRSTNRRIANQLAVIAASATLFMASAAFAASPGTSLIEGVMTSSGGGAAADGTYDVTFSLWEAEVGGAATWTEGPVKVAVKGGQFSYALGTASAIDIKKVAALKAQWLGLKIGADPALPRQKVHSSLFALWAGTAGGLTCTGCLTSDHIANGTIAAGKMGFNYAGSDTKGGPASDLKCTGCVSVAEMKFDANVDLGTNSFKAKNGTFSGDVAAATVTSTSFIGDGSKLTGIKTPSGECKVKGEVVKGINADGSLKCVAALDPSALPADGLNEISNDMLTNQFVYSVSAPVKKLVIPDNQGIEAVSNITFPNIGTAQTIKIAIALENTDLSTVSMLLLPPDDKKTGWQLCDPCGKKHVKKYSTTFTLANPPQAQNGSGKKIADFIGTNIQGLWTLKVKDTSFCIPQATGNAIYCDVNNKTDGWVSDWSIEMQYISNKKVAVNGDLVVSGNIVNNTGTLSISGSIKLGSNTTCNVANKGAIRDYLDHIQQCNGYVWTKLNGALYRYATWHSHDQAHGWFADNRVELFGGVSPYMWGNAGNSGKAHQMSSNSSYLKTLYQTSRSTIAGRPSNVTVHSRSWYMYSSTDSEHSSALFRIHNSTSKAISWTWYWYATAHTGWGEYASVALNGSGIWAPNSTYGASDQHLLTVTFPPNRTSTLIFIAASSSPSGAFRANLLAFYNNTITNIPAGLMYVDDLDWKKNGWDN